MDDYDFSYEFGVSQNSFNLFFIILFRTDEINTLIRRGLTNSRKKIIVENSLPFSYSTVVDRIIFMFIFLKFSGLLKA